MNVKTEEEYFAKELFLVLVEMERGLMSRKLELNHMWLIAVRNFGSPITQDFYDPYPLVGSYPPLPPFPSSPPALSPSPPDNQECPDRRGMVHSPTPVQDARGCSSSHSRRQTMQRRVRRGTAWEAAGGDDPIAGRPKRMREFSVSEHAAPPVLRLCTSIAMLVRLANLLQDGSSGRVG